MSGSLGYQFKPPHVHLYRVSTHQVKPRERLIRPPYQLPRILCAHLFLLSGPMYATLIIISRLLFQKHDSLVLVHKLILIDLSVY